MGRHLSTFAALAVLATLCLTRTADAASPTPQDLVRAATMVVGQLKSDPDYAAELRSARAVILIPDARVPGQVQALLLQHDGDGLWSPPVFITVGPLTVAARSGSQSGPAAMLLMTHRALDEASRPDFTVTAKTDLDIVTYVARHGAPLGEGDVELWSPSGALDGVSLAGARFDGDAKANQTFYGQAVSVPDILAGRVGHQQASADLRRALPL